MSMELLAKAWGHHCQRFFHSSRVISDAENVELVWTKGQNGEKNMLLALCVNVAHISVELQSCFKFKKKKKIREKLLTSDFFLSSLSPSSITFSVLICSFFSISLISLSLSAPQADLREQNV